MLQIFSIETASRPPNGQTELPNGFSFDIKKPPVYQSEDLKTGGFVNYS